MRKKYRDMYYQVKESEYGYYWEAFNYFFELTPVATSLTNPMDTSMYFETRRKAEVDALEYIEEETRQD